VEVLVEAVVPPRSHDHDDSDGAGERTATSDGQVRLSGRTRQHRLVHLEGDPSLVGRFVNVRVDHAGPYSLRGERC
jgi:tRNA A37 methylthiotransferase MiaB